MYFTDPKKETHCCSNKNLQKQTIQLLQKTLNWIHGHFFQRITSSDFLIGAPKYHWSGNAETAWIRIDSVSLTESVSQTWKQNVGFIVFWTLYSTNARLLNGSTERQRIKQRIFYHFLMPEHGLCPIVTYRRWKASTVQKDFVSDFIVMWFSLFQQRRDCSLPH